MSFPICRAVGYPQFDILPVAKITDYPLENWDYKPFAQCRVAINEKSLFVQMWAFETAPEEESSLVCVLHLSDMLKLCIKPKEHSLTIGDREVETSRYTAHPFDGDDLQGAYWGATVTIPLELLPEADHMTAGTVLRGNFYKICTGKRQHFGSYSPVNDWTKPFADNELQELNIIDF